MTRVGIIGMGKMGTAIQELLAGRPDVDFVALTRLNPSTVSQLQNCDVAIEFTTPQAAPEIILQCLQLDIPVVSGTTGWHENHLERITAECNTRKGRLLYATNYSIGMNIVFALNRKLAQLMNQYSEFQPSIREAHHIQKKDIPSGTAYTLLDGIVQQSSVTNGFILNPGDSVPADKIPVFAKREGEVKGYHEVNWTSSGERVFLGHEAFDRAIFASGAIMAANWLMGKQAGVFTMRDVISL